jgi:uncharacterized membrane protein
MATSKQGTLLKIPYDFRAPTISRIRERFWNPDDKRIFTPHIFGWGYAINFYQLLRKLRMKNHS